MRITLYGPIVSKSSDTVGYNSAKVKANLKNHGSANLHPILIENSSRILNVTNELSEKLSSQSLIALVGSIDQQIDLRYSYRRRFGMVLPSGYFGDETGDSARFILSQIACFFPDLAEYSHSRLFS